MDLIGVSIVGASMRSILMFEYLQKYPEQGFVAGIYDIIPDRGKYLAKKYGAPKAIIYKSLDQVVLDPNVDAVFIGTPDCEHVKPALAALQADKNVYCEKPIATSLNECDEIIAVAKNSSKVFYLGMNLRHVPVYQKIYEIVKNGLLGKLLTIEANEYYYGGRSYFRRWNRFCRYSGGLWITKACHDFDILNWIAGSKAKRVFAASSLSHYKPIHNAGINCRSCPIKLSCPDFYDIKAPEDVVVDRLAELTEQTTGELRDLCLYNSDKDTFDNGIAMVEYENDVRATYTVNVVSARDTRQMRLMGTDGFAESDLEEGIVRVWKRHSKEKIVYDLKQKMDLGHYGGDDKVLTDFFRCCRNGDKPLSSWRDGRLSLEAGLAARKSCETGRAVELA